MPLLRRGRDDEVHRVNIGDGVLEEDGLMWELPRIAPQRLVAMWGSRWGRTGRWGMVQTIFTSVTAQTMGHQLSWTAQSPLL